LTTASGRTAWANLKKKLFSDAKPVAAVAAANSSSKVTKPKAAQKSKEHLEPKTPSKPKTATKRIPKSDARVNDESDDDVEAGIFSAGATPTERKIDTCGETSLATHIREDGDDKDAEGNSHMSDIVESIEGEGKSKGKERVTSAAGALPVDGDVSPPQTPIATKSPKPKAAVKKTPKAKAEEITAPNTPTNTADSDAAVETALPRTPSTPKKRKTKAQKEAETADGEDGEQPAKKLRKTPVKRAKKEQDDGDTTTTTAAAEDEPEEKAKKPRKPAVKKDPATPKQPTAAQKAKAEKDAAAAKLKAGQVKAKVDQDAVGGMTKEDEQHAAVAVEEAEIDGVASEKAVMGKVQVEADNATQVLMGKKKIEHQEDDTVKPKARSKPKPGLTLEIEVKRTRKSTSKTLGYK
jgi:hypothetical protein